MIGLKNVTLVAGKEKETSNGRSAKHRVIKSRTSKLDFNSIKVDSKTKSH